MKDMEAAFDENKIKKAVRKAKLKSVFKIIAISIVVFIVGNIANFFTCLKYSAKAYEANEAYVKLSVPGGYISKSNDILGLLGGSGNYTVSKKVGGKPVALEEKISLFGIVPPINYTRQCGAGYHVAGDWPVGIWENGYKKMRFFHPELQYNEYQNDLANIDSIPDGKIIEMAVSFDKPYDIYDIATIRNKLKPAEVTWLWLNEFTEQQLDKFKEQIKTYDNKANGISEYDAIGITSNNGYGIGQVYDKEYDELIDQLSKSNMPSHRDLYEEIMEKGKTSADDAEILGVVVQGTKEELIQLIGNPLIKATSIGVVTDPLY